MEYSTFKQELRRFVLGNEEWNIEEDNYLLYEDGFTSGDEQELQLIRATNIKYHKKEADILIGDIVVLKREKGQIISICRFDLETLYKEFQVGGWERIHYCVNENIKLARINEGNDVWKRTSDYNAIKESLIIRPINYPNNKYELKEAIYKMYGDVALVLYVLLYDNKEMGLGTTKLAKKIFEGWNKDLQEVWDAALVNTYMTAPPRMYMDYKDAINPPYQRGAFMAMNSDMSKISMFQIPTITTTKQRNGAIAMFYPGVQEKIFEMVGGDYYVAFTSVDDVKIHVAGSIKPRSVLQNLKQVNKQFNTKEDVLSNKVFKYSGEKGKLEVLEL